MEKIKNALDPGSSKDTEILYGSGSKDPKPHNLGKVSGEGSHFGSSNAPQPTTSAIDQAAGTSRAANTRTDEDNRIEPAQPNTARQTNSSVPPIPAKSTTGSHSNTSLKSGIPGNSTETKYESLPTSAAPQIGKDELGLGEKWDPEADIAATVHRAQIGAYPTSQGINSESPSKGGAFADQGTHATNPHGHSPLVAHDSSLSSTQQYSAAGADPRVDGHSQARQDQHHYGRDAAVGAGATGAGGAAVYEAKKHHDERQPLRQHEPTTSTTTTTTTTMPGTQPQTTQQYSTSQEKDHHFGRDATVGGGAAAAGGTAAYEAKQKHLEKEQEEQQKQMEKEQAKAEKQHEKEVKKEQKEHEKAEKKAEKEHKKEVVAVEKEQKKHEKEVEKEQKKAEKEHEKEAEMMEKQRRKEEQQREKEADAEYVGIKEEDQRLQKEAEKEQKRRREEEAAAGAATAGGGGAAAYEYEKHNRLQDRQQVTQSSQTANQQPVAGYSTQTQTYGERQVPQDHKLEGEEQDEKKRGGILGLFSRNKDADEKEEKTTSATQAPAHREPVAAAAVQDDRTREPVQAQQQATGAYDPHEGRNKLHKEPPPEIRQKQQELAGTSNTVIDPKAEPALHGTDGLPVHE